MEDLNLTYLPNTFIDNYMPEAHPAYCTVYIYSFRHSFNNRISISIKDTAAKFKILESDVVNAWQYWKSKKLVELTLDDNNNINIEFLSNKKEVISSTKEIAPVQKTKTILIDNKPIYSPKELEMYKDNYVEISQLFSTAESALGKMLSSNDLSTVFSFYDWLRLPVDVIEILLNYCSKNNHRNIRYIEKVAIDWAENNINTKELAYEYITTFNKDYREILKALGQGSRNPIASEIVFMKKWLNELNMPLNIILEACDKTMMQIGKPQFTYIDRIIEGWHKQNVKTIEDIKHIETNYYKAKEHNNKNKKNSYLSESQPKKSKFVNYDQRTRDYDELERLAQERLINNLKGN